MRRYPEPDIPVATLRNANPFRKLWSWARARPAMFATSSAIALGVGSLLWFTVWMATPRNVDTTVHDISWMHITHLRQREIRHNAEWYWQSKKGFYKEPVFNQVCTRRYHYTNTYVCGSYTMSCGKDCTTTVYIYCHDDIYDDWCNYDYFEWPVVDTKQLFGNTHEVSWGTFQPGPLQRVQNIANYEVNFSTSDDEFQYKPDGLVDYRRFTPGDHWTLTVGRIRRHNIEHMEQVPPEL